MAWVSLASPYSAEIKLVTLSRVVPNIKTFVKLKFLGSPIPGVLIRILVLEKLSYLEVL